MTGRPTLTAGSPSICTAEAPDETAPLSLFDLKQRKRPGLGGVVTTARYVARPL